MIKIQYDKAKLSEAEALRLSRASQKIVQEATGIEDVFVYTDCAKMNVGIAPVEIFIEMSARKIDSEEALVRDIKDKLVNWKKDSGFSQPINLTLIPMHWKIEIGI